LAAGKTVEGGFFMKRSQFLRAGIAALALIFGVVLAGCDNGTTSGGNSAKTLVIQNIPANVYAYGQSGGQIGIFPSGTTPEQAMSSSPVAAADLENGDIKKAGSGPYTLTIPLYNTDDGNRWTGSGTFTVYVQLNGGGGHYYSFSSVSISSGTTTLSFNSATDVTSGNSAKTLVIQSIPASVYAYGQNGGQIGIFPSGTTPQQAMSYTGIIAGADLSNGDIKVTGSGPYTLIIPLYDTSDYSRWTGSGTFTVYVVLNGGPHYYRANSVSISSGTTTIPFSSATEVSP
jgi:hypothetical protein